MPDILLVSEITRDCKEYGNYIVNLNKQKTKFKNIYINIKDAVKVIAETLKLNAAYVAEYIETYKEASGN